MPSVPSDPGRETDRQRAEKQACEPALTAFRDRRFDEARRMFSGLATDGDAPSLRMLERVGSILAGPDVADFDPAYDMRTKRGGSASHRLDAPRTGP